MKKSKKEIKEEMNKKIINLSKRLVDRDKIVGGIITGAITIETLLDVILEFKLKEMKKDELLKEIKEKRYKFYTKIKIYQAITDDSGMIKNLDYVRQVRNSFAHGLIMINTKTGELTLSEKKNGKLKRKYILTETKLEEIKIKLDRITTSLSKKIITYY